MTIRLEPVSPDLCCPQAFIACLTQPNPPVPAIPMLTPRFRSPAQDACS